MRLVLKYLLLLRCLLIGGQLLALGALHWALGGRVPWGPVLAVLAVMAVVTAVSWPRVQRGAAVRRGDFVLQLGVDIACLGVLVYFTGGSVNPFISLFLLPIVFSAAAMPPGPTALVATAAVVCYTLLMFFHVPIDHTALHARGVDLHLWGMWYGFLLSAACIAAFVARIARALRAHERALAEAREQALRAERVMALGTLAAGTAHELGTPLATMAVVTKELMLDFADKPAAQHSLSLMRTELARCKEILARLATDVGEMPADQGRAAAIDEFLGELVSDWQALHPSTAVRFECRGAAPAPRIIADRTVRQAIVNILNNAADASPDAVEILGSWDAEAVRLEIRDGGPGIAPRVIQRLGRDPISTKGERGMGLGLYLAHSVFERLGGRVEFDRAARSGTHVTLTLPLPRVAAAVPGVRT